MSYVHDVFISYRRTGEWPKWVKEIFVPLFRHWLCTDQCWESEPDIFVDYTIEPGASWPQSLANDLAKSRVLVPLWTPPYFTSNWCKAELAHMYERERQCGLRTKECPYGLIMPVALHDGDCFPPDAKAITYLEVQKYAQIRYAKGSKLHENLEKLIRNWVPDVAHAIARAPHFDPSWVNLSTDNILGLFSGAYKDQIELPRLDEP